MINIEKKVKINHFISNLYYVPDINPTPAWDSLGLLKSCILIPSAAGTTANPLSNNRASPFPFELPLGLSGACSEDSSNGGSSAFRPKILLHNGEV